MTVEEQIAAVLEALGDTFGPALQGVWLHGSGATSGLRPDSDIDLLAILDRSMEDAERRNLVGALLMISGPHPPPPGGSRCLEVAVFAVPFLSSEPCRSELLYGEWLRARFETGECLAPDDDPDNILLLAQARMHARPLVGPAAAGFIPEIPADAIRAAMHRALPALMNNLDGDERNVLLTLARMWMTAETGGFASKDVAAEWAVQRLPEEAALTMRRARDGYLGIAADDWTGRKHEARATAEVLQAAISRSLGHV